MKGKKILSLLLLTGMLASCRTSVDDSETNPEPVWPSSESSSEQDHSHDSSESESESESESHSGGGGGSSSSEEVDPCVSLGHTLYHYDAKEATCTEVGYKEAWYCNECGELFFTKPSKVQSTSETNKSLTTNTDAILPALGHDYPDTYVVINVPDCEHNGLQIRECTRCGHEDEKVVPKLNHNYGPVTYDPDFVNKTITASTHCANGHDLVETVNLNLIKSEPGTCTTKGVDTYRSAKFSNDAFDQQTINRDTAIKHKLTYYAATPSTCNTHGTDAYYECKGGCGKYFANEGATIEIALNSWINELDHDNHQYLEDVIAKNPTCTSVGYNAHKICPACGERIGYEEISMTPHNANLKKWVKLDDNYHARACKDCDTLLPETKVAHVAEEHDPGYTGDIYCKDCGYLMQVGSGEQGHTHQLTYVPGKEATCTEEGYKYYYSCQCGKMFSDEAGENEIPAPEAISVVAHNYEHHAAQAPNCEVNGNYAYARCKECNQYFLETDLNTPVDQSAIIDPAPGHTISTVWSNDATYHWHQCLNCTHEEDKAIHIPSHPLNDELYEEEITCKECGYVIREERHVHNNGHLTLIPAVNPSCNTAGSSAYYVCECGKYFSDANGTNEIEKDSWIVDPLGHDHMIHHERVTPTCNSTGMAEYYECSRCPAKETYDGEKYTLVIDPSTLVLPIDPNNHVHLEEHDAVNPTCTASGSSVYYSCICGKYYSDSEGEHQINENSWIISPLGHEYGGDYYSDELGHWQKCIRCNEDEAEKHVHDPDREEPTETEPVKCTVCGYIITPATGHEHKDNLTFHEAHTATCTTDGNTAYYSCSCGLYFEDNQANTQIVKDSWVIKAHHTYVPESGTPATCISTGIKDHYVCSECEKIFLKDANNNYTETNEEGLVISINPTNHALALTHHEAQEATCGSAGNIENYYCCDCKNYYSNAAGTTLIPASSIIIPATSEHTFGEWENTTAATCTTVGEDTRVCSVCNHEEHREVPALGHNIVHVDAKSASCTEAGNKEYWKCTRCNKYYSDAGLTNEITPASVVIPALEGGHEYVVDTSVGINGFKFSTDGKTAEVYLKCTKTPGETHTDHFEVDVTSTVKTPATCTEKGVTTYTATYGDYNASVDKTDIDVLGHNWTFVNITFGENGKTATVNYVCSRDENHTTSLPATVEGVQNVAPTCENKGTTRYTASIDAFASLDGQEHVLTKDVNDIAALGHDWTFTGFVFSDDGKSATANYVCDNDSSHAETINDSNKITVIGEITTPATCEEEGITTYTASIQASDSLDGQPHIGTTTREDVEPLGHNYVTYYTWTSSSTSVAKDVTCQNDTTHTTHTAKAYTNSRSSYVSSGDLTDMANALNGTSTDNYKEKTGDINVFMTNIKDGEKANLAFEVELDITLTNSNVTSSYSNGIVVKIDNGFHYDRINPARNTGNSYLFLKSNGATANSFSQGNNKFSGFANVQFTQSTESIPEGFNNFVNNSRVVVKVKLLPNPDGTANVIITVTYYPTDTAYDSYSQTVTATWGSQDMSEFNLIEVVRVARMDENTTLTLNSVTFSDTIDHDVVGKCSNGWGWSVNEDIIVKKPS